MSAYLSSRTIFLTLKHICTLAGAEGLSTDSYLNDYDFAYRGVLPILVGFNSTSQFAANKAARSKSRLAASSQSQQQSPSRTSGTRSIYSDISRSLRKGDEAQTKNAAYSAAVSALVKKRKIDGTFAISSSSFASQRKVALQSCGQDWEQDADVVCAKCVHCIAVSPIFIADEAAHADLPRKRTMRPLLGMPSFPATSKRP